MDRRARLGTSYVVHEQDCDRTGKVSYAFNALGYRGEPFRAEAAFRIHVFGESTAFGLGVELEEAWTSRLARTLLAERGIAPEHACCSNFAESGISNAHIARLVVTQCSAVRPDFVIVQLADTDRTEIYVGDVPYPVGPWFTHAQTEASVLGLPAEDPQRARLVDVLHRGRCYLQFTNRAHGILDALRNALLIQSFLAARGIPYVMVAPLAEDPADTRDGDPILAPLRAALDLRRYVRVPLGAAVPVADRGKDGSHLGPRTHAAVASFVHAALLERGASACEPRPAS